MTIRAMRVFIWTPLLVLLPLKKPQVPHCNLRYLGAHLGVPAGALAVVDATLFKHTLRDLGVHLGVPGGVVAL